MCIQTSMIQPVSGLRYKAPLAAIRLGAADRVDHATPAADRLLAYMRGLSLLWIGQGLFFWLAVLSGADQRADLFEALPFLAGTAVVVFCVLDLVAAVGLWLGAAWGGVVWLVVVALQWMAVFSLPALFPFEWLVAVADLALVAGYFFLTYRAARESEPFV